MLTKLTKWAAIVGMVTLVYSCVVDSTETDTTGTGAPDFSSHNTDYSILVRNNTGERLVAFKGELQADKLVGGIPAHAQNHGLPGSPALFDKTEDFPLILLTEAQYNANKSNLQSQRNTPFTRVYVFYNKNGTNDAHYEIAAGLGGNNTLTVILPSMNTNVEIRVGGVAGETIGYAPLGMLTTDLKLENGDYNLFPVFVRYNRNRDVVEKVYPKNAAGTYNWFFPLTFDGTNSPQTMNLADVLRGLSMSSGAAWVVVDNQTTSGAIRFFEGNIPRTTPAGYQGISAGTPITFQIDMNAVPGANGEIIYANSRDVSNWTFGPQGFAVGLRQGDDDATPLGTLTVYKDTMYTITVKGDFQNGGLRAYISNETAIPLNDFAVPAN